MTETITNATRRARGYWFIDGLAEIGAGLLFMVVSIPTLLWSLAAEGSSEAKLASGSRDILLVLGILLLYIVVRAVKLRSTYARTGYVDDQRPSRKQVFTAGAIGVAGVLVLGGLMVAGMLLFPVFRLSLFKTLAYVPTIFGFFPAIILVILGFRTGLRRFYLLAGVAVLASLGLAVNSFTYLAAHHFDWTFITNASPMDLLPTGSDVALTDLFHYVYTGAAIFAAVIGLFLLISGLIVRRNYLRQNPVSQEEADGR
jgi:hypothetical protein